MVLGVHGTSPVPPGLLILRVMARKHTSLMYSLQVMQLFVKSAQHAFLLANFPTKQHIQHYLWQALDLQSTT